MCLGIFGNALYKKHLEKKYNEAAGLDYELRKQECIRNGGTSAGAVIVYILLDSLLGVIFAAVAWAGILASII